MPVADYKTYCTMLDRARTRRFALPAVNVASLTTGSTKSYDPRSYLALAEAAMAERVKQAANNLCGKGETMFAS